MASDTVEISRREYEGMKETIEVLQDQEMLEAIDKGLEQVREGNTREWSDVKEDIGI